MKRLTKEQVSEIINFYNAGMQPKEIGEKFGIYNNSVTRLLKKNGIERNKLERIGDNDIKYIKDQYVLGKSSTVIALELGICDSTVGRILKRNNILIRQPEDSHRKYIIDQEYFNKIDTEEKSYFLGFLYADGNLSKIRHTIKLELHAQDIDILEKFSTAIYNIIKIGKDNRIQDDGSIRTYLYTVIYSKKMHSDLIKLGCPPHKSFDIRFPTIDIVPQDLLRHFIRGYFDGDGCISIANPLRPVIDFSSNAIFINELILYLDNIEIKHEKIYLNKKNNLSANVQLHGMENIKKLYNYMYDESTIYLQRKYNKFQEFLKIYEDKLGNKQQKISNIDNYGTTLIPIINDIQITADNVKSMSQEEKDNIAVFIVKFYRENGFPCPLLTDDELIQTFTTLKNTDPNLIEKDNILRNDNQSGLKIFKHFSPQFFEVKSGVQSKRPSMLETFEDDVLLLKVIKNRLNYNYHINGNMLRQGLVNSKVAFKSSVFNPVIAKYIYEKYTKDNDIIYDYSMGFGQRLTAALSLKHKITYIGVDPYEKSVESNNNIYNFYNKNIPLLNKEAELICIGSEQYCDPKFIGKVNLAFSSPPYFTLEKYCDDSSQAYKCDYKTFINKWWRQTASNINNLLYENGVFIININDMVDGFNIGEDMCNVIKEQGFKLIDTYKIKLSKNLEFTKNKDHKYEPIYVFKK